jgi:hypothetical protein
LLADNCLEFGGILAVTNRDAVGILLPGDTNVVAMTEQTLVAMNKFGDRFADVVTAPRGGILFLIRDFCGLLTGGVNTQTGQRQR